MVGFHNDVYCILDVETAWVRHPSQQSRQKKIKYLELKLNYSMKDNYNEKAFFFV